MFEIQRKHYELIKCLNALLIGFHFFGWNIHITVWTDIWHKLSIDSYFVPSCIWNYNLEIIYGVWGFGLDRDMICPYKQSV